MKLTALVALCAIPAVCVPSAAKEVHPVIVTGHMNSIAQWSNGMTDKINRNLDFPYEASERTADGIVSVAFRCSDEGLPAALKVVRKSGDSRLDRAALRAISRVSTMHPLPVGVGPGQKFQANIIFASSQGEYDRQLRKLRTDVAKANRAMDADDGTLVLNVTPNPRG
ncbi:energy transducer TonB [Novosphingobium tardum]|uniref:Energy transducer TonB n=1 Tax=Novosphingobium tardum TaxID=1538021 RepID=A0ABV8RS83_9SPHN